MKIKNKKGASVLIEQIFIVLFGIILLVLIVVVFSTVREKSIDSVSQTQYEGIANQVLSGIAIANKDMQISEIGRVFLDLPDRVGGEPYRISIVNGQTINVTDLGNVKNATVAIFNFNSSVSGNVSSGSRIFLEYNKSANSISLTTEERVIS